MFLLYYHVKTLRITISVIPVTNFHTLEIVYQTSQICLILCDNSFLEILPDLCYLYINVYVCIVSYTQVLYTLVTHTRRTAHALSDKN